MLHFEWSISTPSRMSLSALDSPSRWMLVRHASFPQIISLVIMVPVSWLRRPENPPLFQKKINTAWKLLTFHSTLQRFRSYPSWCPWLDFHRPGVVDGAKFKTLLGNFSRIPKEQLEHDEDVARFQPNLAFLFIFSLFLFFSSSSTAANYFHQIMIENPTNQGSGWSHLGSFHS